MKINVSNDTCELLKAQLSKKSKKYIRINVAGFGWGGPAFGIVLEEQINNNDIVVNIIDLTIIVDSEFEEFLDDSTISHSKNFMGTTFKVKSKHSSC